MRVSVQGGPDPTTCAFTFAAPAALGVQPTLAPSVTTGC